MHAQRICFVVRGSRQETGGAAQAHLSLLDPKEVLWVGAQPGEWPTVVPPHDLRKALGLTFSAVVLDVHDGLDADALGRSTGCLRAGGVLVLRLPDRGRGWKGPRPHVSVHPFEEAPGSWRMERRFERLLEEFLVQQGEARLDLEALRTPLRGTLEQREVVGKLHALFAADTPSLAVMVAPRGRGKSSALGLALAKTLGAMSTNGAGAMVVSAATRDGVDGLLRHGFPEGTRLPLPRFLTPLALAELEPNEASVIVMDEAAQVAVPLLCRILRRHAKSTMAFATTVHGYEGSGRGFLLRFVEALRQDPRPLHSFSLTEPIRWAAGDALEQWVLRVLALEADSGSGASMDEATSVADGLTTRGTVTKAGSEAMVGDVRRLEQDDLAANDALLDDAFGLLVQAHYRTTPGDLLRLLDAPNMVLHGLYAGPRLVGVNLLAFEGGLPPETCDAVARGAWRIRGHALADSLMTHGGMPEAGRLTMVRSVRLAVRHEFRHRGAGARLVNYVHDAYKPDLYGTLFGATPALLKFRQHLGYELVRLGSGRGERSGEPSALMLHPRTAEARDLVAAMRKRFALAWPWQKVLLESEDGAPLDTELARAIEAGLIPAEPMSEEEERRGVEWFVGHAQSFEAAAHCILPFVLRHRGNLSELPERARRLLLERANPRKCWVEVSAAAGFTSTTEAMRHLRFALRLLLEQRTTAS